MQTVLCGKKKDNQVVGYYYAWSTTPETYEAVDIFNIKDDFDTNRNRASVEIDNLKSETPKLIKSLDDNGVYYDAAKGFVAIDFTKASKEYHIAGLP